MPFGVVRLEFESLRGDQTFMQFKLNVKNNDIISNIAEVVEFLSTNVSPSFEHDRMTMKHFYMGRDWRIENHRTHWEVYIVKKRCLEPWFTEFKLRWVI